MRTWRDEHIRTGVGEAERLARSRSAHSAGDDWGHSESLDPDDVGDIADEGAGHRG
jgi:hypothetical protein